MWKIAGRALKGPLARALALAAFVAPAAFDVPFPVVVVLSALAALALPAGGEALIPPGPPVWRHAGLTLAALVAIVGGVYLLDRALFGAVPHDGVAALSATAALVTLGGAYAVLPFVADQAVALGWLTPAEMLNGLAIAEARPGPLILVNTYAGFFAGWSAEGGFGAGAHAAALASFYTFAPSTA